MGKKHVVIHMFYHLKQQTWNLIPVCCLAHLLLNAAVKASNQELNWSSFANSLKCWLLKSTHSHANFMNAAVVIGNLSGM